MRVLIAFFIVLMLAVPTGVNALLAVPLPPKLGSQRGQALILSSLNQTQPMGQYGKDAVWYLTHAGYNVTIMNDGQITVDLLLNRLKNYSIVIWRTDSYTWKHVTYWWVGEKVNDGVQNKYSADFAQGYLNVNTGIVGLTSQFFTNHLKPKTWTGISLLMFLASNGNAVAPVFVTAGASSVIYCNGVISLGFGLIDDLAVQMIAYLTQGESVYSAVYNTVSPFNQYQGPKDPLDNTYPPPFWFIGDGSVIISPSIQATPPES